MSKTMTPATILVDNSDADRCNRQAKASTLGTNVKFGDVTLVLGRKVSTDADGYDIYEVTFAGATVETAPFSSAFVACYFFEQSLLNSAAIMAKVTGSVSATAREEYRALDGALVVLGEATWVRG